MVLLFDGFFDNNFWLEVASDVISGEAEEEVSTNVSVNLGGCKSNRSWDLPVHSVMDNERRMNEYGPDVKRHKRGISP